MNYLKYLCLAIILFTSKAFAQRDCDFEDISKLFERGLLEDGISTFNNCKESLDINDRKNGYVLAAEAYIELNELELAGEVMESILAIDFTYNPALYDKSRIFIWLFNKIKLERSSSVFSVSKTSELKEEAPATIIVVTDEDIRHRGYQSIEEVLHDLPGFDISTGRGPAYSNIYQRGYRSNQTDHTLLLIDGVEMNDLSSHNAFISRQYNMSDIKQIEVVYGPISNIYGANAFSGVINVITRETKDVLNEEKFALKSSISAGSWNTGVAEVSSYFRSEVITSTLSARVFSSDEMDLSTHPNWVYDTNQTELYRSVLTQTDTDDITEILGVTGNENYFTASDGVLEPTDFAIQEAMRLDDQANPIPSFQNPSKNFSVSGKFRISDFSLGFQAWKKDEGNVGWYDWQVASNNLRNSWIVNNSTVYLKYEKPALLKNKNLDLVLFTRFKSHKISPKTRFVRLYSYLNGRLDGVDLINGGLPLWNTTHYYRVSNQLRMEARGIYRFKTKGFDLSQVMFGTEVRSSQIQGDYIRTSNDAEFTEIDSDLLSNGNYFNYQDEGFFAESVFKKGSTKFTLGGRLDFNSAGISGGYGSAANIRASALQRIDSVMFIKVNYSTAFKDASPFTKYSQSSNRIANPGLEPEKIKNIEFSAIYKPTDDFSVDATIFHSSISNMIGITTIDNNRAMNQNIGTADISGGHVVLTKGVGLADLSVNYSYLRPVTHNDTIRSLTIGDMAKHRLNLVANLKLSEDWNANFRINVVGKRRTGEGTSVPTNPNSYVSAYQVINSVITYQPLDSNWAFQLITNNLLDKQYDHPGVRTAGDGNYTALLPQNRWNIHFKIYYEFAN